MDDKKSSDFLWKIVLCGDSFVGKTTVRKRAMGEHFAEEYISTVGADFSSYKLKFGDLTIGFQVWDLAGQDKYKYIRSSFYGGATGCFLVFDTTNPISMKSLSIWVDEAIRYSNGTIEIFIICANKVDLKNQREISKETGLKYTQALRESSGLQCEYIETSALTGENIDIAFDKMARCLLEREGISPIKPKEVAVTEETIELIAHDEKIQKETELETMEKAVEQPLTKIIETIPSKRKSIIEEDTEEETEKLIAEVMAVLDETDEIIIGRKTTKDGEKAITVSRNTIESMTPKKEKEPKISNELERVLKQINFKLDSLTERLKDLEEEISYTKDTSIFASEIVEDEEKEDEIINEETFEETPQGNLSDEIDLLAQLSPPMGTIEEEIETEESLEEEYNEEEDEELVIQEEETDDSNLTLPNIDDTNYEVVKEDAFDDEQKVLESLLETTPFEAKTDYEDKFSLDKESVAEVVETEKKGSSTIRGLQEVPDNGYVEIPNQEPLLQ